MPEIFEGWSVGFISASLGRKRLGILKRIVEENGGRVLDIPPCEVDRMRKFSAGPHHALLVDAKGAQDISHLFDDCRGDDDLGGIECYSIDWISESVKEGILKEIESFRVSTGIKRIKIEPKQVSKKESLLDPSFINTPYECLRPSPLDHKNKRLVAGLQKIAHHRYLTGNSRSELSYNKAIAALKAYPRDVGSIEEAREIQGIGPKIVGLIVEYLSTGRIKVADEALDSEEMQVLDALTKIHGVGPKTAKQWYDMGIRSVADLQEAALQGDVSLQNDQLIGIKYYDDFQLGIPREEVEQILESVRASVKRLFGERVLAEGTGGWRRGKGMSGDVDILIHPLTNNGPSQSEILDRLVTDMKATGHIKEILTISKTNTKTRTKQPTGLDVCYTAFLLPHPTTHSPMRRVDFIVARPKSYPFAQLGWTGSRQFERAIRLYAHREHGLTLTDHGISGSAIGMEGFDEERQIFEFLGMPYLDPTLRNC